MKSNPYQKRRPWAFVVRLLCWTSLFFSVTLNADDRDKRRYTTAWRSGTERLEVDIESADFVPARHQIRMMDNQTYVDGQRALGIDGTGRIETEIRTFVIKWNGKQVVVPRAAYAPIFNFSLRKASLFPEEMGELLGARSSKNNALLFVFAGGTESVREWVWLVVTRDGKWFRFEGGDGESPL